MSDTQRRLLASWIRAGTTPQRVVRRARIVLLAADALSMRTIAQQMQVTPRTVALWRGRFEDHGPEALCQDAPGRGRKRSMTNQAATRLRELMAAPPSSGDRWSIRKLAKATGFSRASVHRIVRAFKADR